MILLRSIEIIIMLVYSKILIVIVIIIDNLKMNRHVNLKKIYIILSFVLLHVVAVLDFVFFCLSPMPCNLFLVS